MSNKYGAVRAWSALCNRDFHSKAERQRGEDLHMLEIDGEIKDLQYQVPFVLSEKPSVKIIIDFCYIKKIEKRFECLYPDDGKLHYSGAATYEDVKGMMTPTCRVKLAWLREKHGINVEIIK